MVACTESGSRGSDEEEEEGERVLEDEVDGEGWGNSFEGVPGDWGVCSGRRTSTCRESRMVGSVWGEKERIKG